MLTQWVGAKFAQPISASAGTKDPWPSGLLNTHSRSPYGLCCPLDKWTSPASLVRVDPLQPELTTPL